MGRLRDLPYIFAVIYGTLCTVCPGSSYPAEKIFNIFASENEVYAGLRQLLTITIL